MPLGKQILEERLHRATIGNVVHPLASLVLDDIALVIEVLLRQSVEEITHPIRFCPEHQLQRARRDGLEVVRAVEVGGTVDASLKDIRACSLHQRHIFALHVLRALEHHVLEEMSEPRFAQLLVLGPDVIPEVDVNHRKLVILVEDHIESVGEREFLERKLRNGFVFHLPGVSGQREIRGSFNALRARTRFQRQSAQPLKPF